MKTTKKENRSKRYFNEEDFYADLLQLLNSVKWAKKENKFMFVVRELAFCVAERDFVWFSKYRTYAMNLCYWERKKQIIEYDIDWFIAHIYHPTMKIDIQTLDRFIRVFS